MEINTLGSLFEYLHDSLRQNIIGNKEQPDDTASGFIWFKIGNTHHQAGMTITNEEQIRYLDGVAYDESIFPLNSSVSYVHDLAGYNRHLTAKEQSLALEYS